MSSNLPLQVKEQWWGAELPPPRDDSVPQPQLSLWRPWEGKMEKGGLKKKLGGFKERSPAAETCSLGRLLIGGRKVGAPARPKPPPTVTAKWG